MPVNWLHNNKHLLTEALSESPIIRRFSTDCEEKGEDSYDIIATNQLNANQLLNSFSILEDAFQNLQIRFGWIDKEGMDINLGINPERSIIVGQDIEIKGFMKIPVVKTLNMSNTARNNSLYLGYQRHMARHNNPYSVSLGEMKEDLSESETMVRSAECLHFCLDVMKKEDSGNCNSHSVGLDIYTCCSLFRLAGMSKALKLFCINTNNDQINEKSADAITLMIWYFLEGLINKNIETMKQKENDIFLVSSELYDEPIKFVVGHKTGRWWYQHPSTKEYVPCSDKDYKAISVGNLPDSIVSLQN